MAVELDVCERQERLSSRSIHHSVHHSACHDAHDCAAERGGRERRLYRAGAGRDETRAGGGGEGGGGGGGGGGERHLCVAGSENGLVFCLLQRLPPSECLLGTRPLVDPAVFICMTAPRKTREFRLPKNVPRSAAEHVSPTSFPACRVCPTRRVFKAGVRCGACVGRRGGRCGGRVSGAVSGECASAPSCTAERVRPA